MKTIQRYKEEDQFKNFKPLARQQEEDLIAACGWTQNRQTKVWTEDSRIAHLKPIVVTAVDTGIRLSEILGLKWSQVSFADDLITLTKTKNHKARQIPISGRLKRVLLDWRRQAPGEDWVFCSKLDGEALGTIKKSFTSARRKAGVKIHFHGLRHGFATKLLAAGVDIKTVQDLMGHTSITATARYLHSNLDKKRAAILALARVQEPVEISPNCDLSVTRTVNSERGREAAETLSAVSFAG